MDPEHGPNGSRVFGNCDVLMEEIINNVLDEEVINAWEIEREQKMEQYSKHRCSYEEYMEMYTAGLPMDTLATITTAISSTCISSSANPMNPKTTIPGLAKAAKPPTPTSITPISQVTNATIPKTTNPANAKPSQPKTTSTSPTATNATTKLKTPDAAPTNVKKTNTQ